MGKDEANPRHSFRICPEVRLFLKQENRFFGATNPVDESLFCQRVTANDTYLLKTFTVGAEGKKNSNHTVNDGLTQPGKAGCKSLKRFTR